MTRTTTRALGDDEVMVTRTANSVVFYLGAGLVAHLGGVGTQIHAEEIRQPRGSADAEWILRVAPNASTRLRSYLDSGTIFRITGARARRRGAKLFARVFVRGETDHDGHVAMVRIRVGASAIADHPVVVRKSRLTSPPEFPTNAGSRSVSSAGSDPGAALIAQARAALDTLGTVLASWPEGAQLELTVTGDASAGTLSLGRGARVAGRLVIAL